MRRAARKDANHREIIRAFESMGASVIDVSDTPCGFDILCGHGGLCIAVEIKDGSKPPSARRLTANEKRVHERWTGGMRIVESVEDAIATVCLLRKWHAAICRST